METKELEIPVHERRDILARARREMEAALILEQAPFDMENNVDEKFDTYVLEWLERNTVAFRRSFDELREDGRDLAQEWHDHPQKILAEIKSLMEK